MAGFISLADAKAQLRVDDDEEDVLIQGLIDAASLHVERKTGLVAGTRDQVFTFDQFARTLELSRRPVDLETIEVRYFDGAGVEQTFVDFRAFVKNGTVRIAPAIGHVWPSAACVYGAISISATVGFAVTDEEGAAAAPDDAKHAVRLCVASWFRDREAGPIPPAVNVLLDDERARRV